MTNQEQLKLLRARAEKLAEEAESLFEQINEIFAAEYNTLVEDAEDPDDEEFLVSISSWDQVFSVDDDALGFVIDAINAALAEEGEG
jgi:hypothetical protein